MPGFALPLIDRQSADDAEARPQPASARQPHALPAPGDLLDGCYRIREELGRGAMGRVFLAADEKLQRRVAIKFLDAVFRGEALRGRFLMEARAMALVAHPNVASIFAFGEHAGVPYFVMEYVEGGSLGEWLARSGAQFDVDHALEILDDVCHGVSALHAVGTVHRDLKPSNLLLDADGRAKVADFGLAARSHDGRWVHEVTGTLAYMAPEIALCEGEQAAAANELGDVYALGCIAYELLTGQLPFEAENDLALMLRHATETVQPASELRPELTQAFDQVLACALEKTPARRTPSAELFREQLRAAHERSLLPAKILIVEDDPDFRELLALELSAAFPDSLIECVADGHAAIRAFDAAPASIVLLDLELPDLDGMGVTAVLRAREAARSVPIVVLTAAGGPAEWQRMAALGADRFLLKPANLDDVVSGMRNALRERRREHARRA